MSYFTSLKLRQDGQGYEVLCEVLHPMHGGGQDESGGTTAANYITQMVFRRNGNIEAEFLLGRSIARHPVIGTYIQDAQEGQVISVSWQDLAGNRGQAAITIK